jgi:hypothetical protein
VQPGTFIPQTPPAPGREIPPPDLGLAPGSIQIPGNPANNISVRQNNPFNLKYVGQPEATGAGTRGFAIFPNAEAGVQAGIKQIQLDQSRGLSFGQFAEKYAPSYENPGWASDVAKMVGASSETPLAQIPTMNLAQAIAKRESSTTLPQQMAQTQIPSPQIGQMPSGQTPAQPIQQGGVITPQKFIEGYFEKKYGVKPDKAHVVPYGDHKLVVDEKGNPRFMIAGQGKMEMVDFKLPDGSIIKKPILVPPTPLPGGIPVYNVAGQAAGDMAASQPMMVAPPEVTRQEITQPSGAKFAIPVPKPQMGQAPLQTEPGKAETQGIQPYAINDVGRANMILHAQQRIGDIKEQLFPDGMKGSINRDPILKSSGPLGSISVGGIGTGATLFSRMYQAVDAALRLETGAQANIDEIKIKMAEYYPSIKDTDAVIKQKINDLDQYITRTVNLHDPSGQLRKIGQAAVAGIGEQKPSGLGATPPSLGAPKIPPQDAMNELRRRGVIQ